MLVAYHLFVCPLLKVSGCGKCSVIDNKYTDYWSMADTLHYTAAVRSIQCSSTVYSLALYNGWYPELYLTVVYVK